MVTSIIGSNNYARKQALNNLIRPFLKQYGDVGYENIDGESMEFTQLQSSMQSMPFLSDKKLIVVQNPSANKEFISKIEQLLPTIPDSTDVIITESKIDKRLRYFTFLKEQTKFIELRDQVGSDLIDWLTSYVAENNGQIDPQTARNLIGKVGNNQQLLANELDKLLLYNPTITDQSIQLLVEATPQSTIFEMLDRAFIGDKRRTIALYKEQRAQNVEPAQIIAMITWQLHILALIKAASNLTTEQIVKESKQNPFVIRKSLALAKKIESQDLKRMFQTLLELDTRLKTEPIDPDDALQYYLLSLHQ
jgi:DNA polymerase-3 subunit delta